MILGVIPLQKKVLEVMTMNNECQVPCDLDDLSGVSNVFREIENSNRFVLSVRFKGYLEKELYKAMP